MRKFILYLIAGLAITVATGAVYGRLSQRWGPVPDLLASARQLGTLPKQIGDWQFLADEPMSDRIVKMLSCAGYVNRQYVNPRTGEIVYLAITVGPGGPISVHTPEICFSSRAYSIVNDRQPITIDDVDGRTHTFWNLPFRPNSPTADMLHVYYAWSTGDEWLAPNSPRFEFAGQPSLHKLQIASLVPPADGENGSTDPCKSFLSDLLKSGWKLKG